MNKDDLYYLQLLSDAEAQLAWRKYWKVFKKQALEEHIEITTTMQNGIRNTWRDGYFTAKLRYKT